MIQAAKIPLSEFFLWCPKQIYDFPVGSASILRLRNGAFGEWTTVEYDCGEKCGPLQEESLEKHSLHTELLPF
jgi:hypothetical protein